MADFKPPDCYAPPFCEDAGKQHFASVIVIIEAAENPEAGEVLILCGSHVRKRATALRGARIRFEEHRI